MASPRTQRTHTDAFVCNISHTFLRCICKMERLARPTPQKQCYNFERKLTRALSVSCSIKTKHIYHHTYVPSFIHINFYFLYAVRAHKHGLASQAGFRCGHKYIYNSEEGLEEGWGIQGFKELVGHMRGGI